MFTPAANILARPLIIDENLKKADLIAVLGGGAYKDGSLGRASNERLIKGLLLYRQGYAPEVIFSGGTLVNLNDKLLHTVTGSNGIAHGGIIESEVMRDIAVKLGMPAKDFALEKSSLNTYENLKGVKKYMEENGLKTCIIVTSSTHMKRASLIASKLGLEFSPAPVKDYSPYRTSALERLTLLREVLWEYAGLALYKVYGYI